MRKLSWQDVVVTVVGMLCLVGIALTAAIGFGIDGKLLLGTGILIACLANTDILKLIAPYVAKYTHRINNKRGK